VHERQLTVHAQSIPSGFSRRVTAYAASAEATEVFRREHPPPQENAYYISSSEDDDCKYADPKHTKLKFRACSSSFGPGTFVSNGTTVTCYGQFPLT
jgi:hypothetical protein